MAASIERMRASSIPPHHKQDETYMRPELGGNTRELRVWSFEACRRKLEEAQQKGRLTEFFLQICHLWGFYVNGSDPMLADWMEENFRRCTTIYDQMVTPVEEFNAVVAPDATTEEIEEFTA